MGNLIAIAARYAGLTSAAWTTVQIVFNTVRRYRKMSDKKNAEEIKALADKVMADFAGVKKEVSDFKGAGLKEIVANIPETVVAVEKFAKTVKLTGDDKKEVAVEIVNRLVDIPFVPEAAEAVIISFAIDAAVAAFNKYGKGWIEKFS